VSLTRSDAELVERTRQGDKDAFGELYDRYAPLVRAACADQTQELAAAQDLAQDVFVRAYERISELREPARFGAWILGIARLAGKEWRRRRQRRGHALAQEAAEEIESTDSESDDRLPTLLGLLAGLPEMERLALHAFYLDGQSAERGAAALDISRSGFYKLLESARRRLALRYRQAQEDL
jgi:RNA polymerase sigma-70 factor (ECF subfamily)